MNCIAAFLAAIAASIVIATAQSPDPRDYVFPHEHRYTMNGKNYCQVFRIDPDDPKTVLITRYYLMDEKRGWWQKLETARDSLQFVALSRYKLRLHMEAQAERAYAAAAAADEAARQRAFERRMEEAMRRAAEDALRRERFRSQGR